MYFKMYINIVKRKFINMATNIYIYQCLRYLSIINVFIRYKDMLYAIF